MNNWINIERIPGPLSSSYEKATRMVIDSYYCQVAEEIVYNLRDGLILDLGTGPGYLPIEIIKKAPNIRIIGIDLNRKLIQVARENAARLGFKDNLTFQFGNSTKLPFEDAYFDMVISTGMLHSLKNPSRVFREIYRVLKSDGEAWIFDPAKVCNLVDQEKWAASLNPREKFFLWLFKFLKLHSSIKTYNRSQVLPMIKSANFKKYLINERKNEIRIKLRK